MNAIRLFSVLWCLLAASCKCDGARTTNNRPEYVATPPGLTFLACPTQDAMKTPIDGVFPDEKRLTLQNLGKVGGALQVKVEGAGAADFKLDPQRVPSMLAAGASVELPVLFSPRSAASTATLVIDDGDVETEPVHASLTGQIKELKERPTIEARIDSFPTTGATTKTCTATSALEDCEQIFPNTPLKDEVRQHIKLRNRGCPALRVTGLEIALSGSSKDPAYSIVEPSVLPTEANPLVMSTADGTDEIDIVVRFAPEADGTQDTQRFATLTVRSNDQTTPALAIALTGQGVSPLLDARPTFCNYNNPDDPCRREGMKVDKLAYFEIKNQGTAPIVINSATFKSSNTSTSGAQGRFTVKAPIDGQTLIGGAMVTLEVEHHDAPLFVTDQITVLSSEPGKAKGSAGSLFLTVAGGTSPCMALDPEMSLNFENPTQDVTVKPVTIKALAQAPGSTTACGDLTIESASIATNPFFTIAAPALAAGMQVKAGQQVQVQVQYKKPITGGQQIGGLLLKTNDPAFGPPAYKTLVLQSKSPLNQFPVCVLKGCTPSMTNCSTEGATVSTSVSLSETFGTGDKQIKLWGADSYDPGNTNMPGISEWQFQVTPPSASTKYTLSGGGAFTSMNAQTLTLDPIVTGPYNVSLVVKDDTGQLSQSCKLRITVVP